VTGRRDEAVLRAGEGGCRGPGCMDQGTRRTCVAEVGRDVRWSGRCPSGEPGERGERGIGPG